MLSFPTRAFAAASRWQISGAYELPPHAARGGAINLSPTLPISFSPANVSSRLPNLVCPTPRVSPSDTAFNDCRTPVDAARNQPRKVRVRVVFKDSIGPVVLVIQTPDSRARQNLGRQYFQLILIAHSLSLGEWRSPSRWSCSKLFLAHWRALHPRLRRQPLH